MPDILNFKNVIYLKVNCYGFSNFEADSSECISIMDGFQRIFESYFVPISSETVSYFRILDRLSLIIFHHPPELPSSALFGS